MCHLEKLLKQFKDIEEDYAKSVAEIENYKALKNIKKIAEKLDNQ